MLSKLSQGNYRCQGFSPGIEKLSFPLNVTLFKNYD